jgi:peptidoglycan/LPS O-acetylase OafA/YrhL
VAAVATTEARRGYVAGGDAFRGYACLVVVAAHAQLGLAALYLGPKAAADPAAAFPVIGHWMIRFNAVIYIFFALSGYLVGGPWVRAWLRGEGFPHFRKYISRRLRRIVPAFWVAITLSILLIGSYGASGGQFAELYLFQHINRPIGPPERIMPQGWTLDIEMAFYLLLPIVAAVLVRLRGVPASPRRRRRILYATLGVVTLVGLYLRAKYQITTPRGRSLASLGWAIAPGLAIAGLEYDHRERIANWRHAKAFAAGLMGASVLAWLFTVAAGLLDGNVVSELCYLVSAYGLLGGGLVWQWATGGAPRWADNPVAHALGRWSFGIYVLHLIVGREVLKHLPDGLQANVAFLITFGIMATVSIAAASVMWWLVEEPFIEKRWPQRPAWSRATAPPQPPVEELPAARQPVS